MTASWFDLGLLLLGALGALAGWRRGGLRLAAVVVGAVVGLFLAVLLARLLPVSPQRQPVVLLLAALLGIAVGAGLASSVGRLLHGIVAAVGLGLVDRAAGLLLGAVAAVVAGWLAVLAAAAGGLPAAAQALPNSVISTELAERLPAVRDVAAQRLPAALTGLLPAAGPDQLRVPASSRSVARRVAASTLLIEGSRCTGGGATGSGVVIAPGRVATAAHVVANMTSPTVSGTDGTHRARVVAYDRSADFAVLAVSGLTSAAVPVRSGYLPNGSSVVVLGHPHGGPLVARPARVELRSPTTVTSGGLHDVDETYWLHAAVAPGSSGGPVVDSRGRLVGLVQAMSVSVSDRAFAITLPPLAGQLSAGIHNTRTVSTGC